jgi:hypothetical protein
MEPLVTEHGASDGLSEPLVTLLERGVSALEKLAADPVIDVPVKPPVCPNCGRMNPSVRVQESEATGPLFEFVIMCECLSCHHPFYAIAEGWNCLANIEHVKQLISERAELAGYEQHSGTNQGT